MQLNFRAHSLIKPKSLHELAGISQAISLNQNVLYVAPLFEKRVQSVDQVILCSATYTPVRHFIEVLNVVSICILHQGAFDAHVC